MLTKSQVHKENDVQVHEHVEADATIAKYGTMENHDQTLNEEMISKNDNILLVGATKTKEYRLTTPKDKSVHIEENLDVEQVVVVK